MSLLSTFGILFETDAEKAKREIDDVDQSLDKTEKTANDTAGSFDDLSGSVDGSAKSFFGLSSEIATAAGGLVTVLGIFAGITSQALATDEIGKFSQTMGLAIEDVGAWGEAVARSGGSSEAFRGSIEGLNGQLTDISLTGGGEASEVFARLGINAIDAGGKIKGAFDVLPELADSFQNLSNAEAVGFGKKLGLDQGTILLLQQGRVAVEDLVKRQKELGVATKEDYEAAALFNDALDDSKQVFANLFTTAGTTILPLLTSMLKGFELIVSWVKQNKTLVTGFFVAVAGVIAAVYLPAMIAASAATLAAAAPFIAIGLAVAAVGAAFAILYEDVVAYLGGQESYIGDLAKKYEWFGEIVDSVINGIKASFETLESVFDWLTDLFLSPEKALNQLSDNISSMIKDIVNMIPDIGTAFDDALSGIKSFFGFGDDEIEANVDSAMRISSSIANNPLNGQTSASIVNSRQSQQKTNNLQFGNTTINTQATDPEGVASAVNGSLNDQVSMAIAQLDDAEAY